jgi:hypothetical protein
MQRCATPVNTHLGNQISYGFFVTFRLRGGHNRLLTPLLLKHRHGCCANHALEWPGHLSCFKSETHDKFHIDKALFRGPVGWGRGLHSRVVSCCRSTGTEGYTACSVHSYQRFSQRLKLNENSFEMFNMPIALTTIATGLGLFCS